jgi:hypothetical protein
MVNDRCDAMGIKSHTSFPRREIRQAYAERPQTLSRPMYNSGWMAERTSALSTPSTITIQAARGRSESRNMKWSGLPDPVPCGISEAESQRYRSPFFAAKGSRV